MRRIAQLRARADRGASAIMFALIGSVVLALGAVGIEYASWNAHRSALLSGTDAASLAIAQDCALNGCVPGMEQGVAVDMVGKNAMGDQDVDVDVTLDEWDQSVEVVATIEHENLVGSMIGHDTTTVQAASAAEWGFPIAGQTALPIAISLCELIDAPGVSAYRNLDGVVTSLDIAGSTGTFAMQSAKTTDKTCTGRAGTDIPGGFYFTDPQWECRYTETEVHGYYPIMPGDSPPSECSYSDFASHFGQSHTVIVPVFDDVRMWGATPHFRVAAYVSFRLADISLGPGFTEGASPLFCQGSERCVSGSFEETVSREADFEITTTGPNFGVAVVRPQTPDHGATP